jgi:GntR family transcriptional regulator
VTGFATKTLLTPTNDCIKTINTVIQGVPMQYEINSASRLPIYQQLVHQVREAIARGDLKPEEQLPSVRQLSRDLVINPNTVARAYTELEREGLLNNRPGRGVFVAEPKDELTRDARRRRLLESVDRFLTEAVHLGFSEQEVAQLVSTRSRQFQWNSAKAGSR